MNTDPARPPMLRAEGIRKRYRAREVLNVPELEIPAGTTFALLGSSGAGKSTLLRILALLERPDEGRVLLDGREVAARDADARRHVVALFQRPYLFQGTVGSNVEYGLVQRRVPAEGRATRVAAALARVGLPGFEDRDIRTLSGGEAQRVALARALVLEPRVLLLDEPLSYMDPLVKQRLVREFAEILHESRMTTLYVTHDQDEAFGVADSVGILHEGRFASVGALDDVMGMPADPFTAAFLGMEPPLPGTIVASDGGLAEVDVGGLSISGPSVLPIGSRVLVAVRPEDVLLFESDDELPRSSARNRIRGVVADVRPNGVMVRVVVAHDGVRIASLVSRAAVAELGIAEGVPMVAVFKAAATRIGLGDDGRAG